MIERNTCPICGEQKVKIKRPNGWRYICKACQDANRLDQLAHDLQARRAAAAEPVRGKYSPALTRQERTRRQHGE